MPTNNMLTIYKTPRVTSIATFFEMLFSSALSESCNSLLLGPLIFNDFSISPKE
jgi:hypothetical protein